MSRSQSGSAGKSKLPTIAMKLVDVSRRLSDIGGTFRPRDLHAAMRLSLIVAMTRSGVIGRGGGLPWRLSSDLRRFKALTMGHHIVMGRRTYDTLRRPLPGRVSLVLKRQSSPYDYDFFDEQGKQKPRYDQVVAAQAAHRAPPPDAVPIAFVPNLEEALRLAADDEEPFVIGGGEIFRLALPCTTRMYVTWVETALEGDAWFPSVDWNPWREISAERHSADAKNEYDTTFCIYERS